MKSIMQRMGYTFRNKSFLENALTHSSYANEGNRALQSNERLEFLGDSVLSVVTSEYLYHEFPHMPEGDLSKLRARLVCEGTLALFSEKIGVMNDLKLGKGEENSGGRTRPSIAADLFEALIAAIYLDGGMEPAKQFILRFVIPESRTDRESPCMDYKTQLQEIVQQNREERVSYVLVSETGPDHDKVFHTEVHLNSNIIGKGSGRNKKESEQRAAREALKLMGQVL